MFPFRTACAAEKVEAEKVKVLVGIPSMNYKDRHHGYLASALKHVEAAIRGVSFEVFVTPPTHKEGWEGLVDRQNLIVGRFLSGRYSYLWHVELDVQVPPDSLKNLLGLDVDIACGYVRRHNGEGLILGFLDENMRVWHLPFNVVRGNNLTGWVMAGTSCVLFKKKVFENGLRFKYLPNVTPDILFMFHAQWAGFTAKAHGDVLCGHLPEFPLETLTGGLCLSAERKSEFEVPPHTKVRLWLLWRRSYARRWNLFMSRKLNGLKLRIVVSLTGATRLRCCCGRALGRIQSVFLEQAIPSGRCRLNLCVSGNSCLKILNVN